MRELRAVRQLLHRHFSAFVSDPRVRKVLVHENNQAWCKLSINGVGFEAHDGRVEKIKVQLRVLGVRIDAWWIPSAVNCYTDAFSWTWDPGDVRATAVLVASIQEENGLDEVEFATRPTGENAVARRKYQGSEMEEDWGDGRAWLWNPPFYMLPLVVGKTEADGGCGVMITRKWPSQPLYARLLALISRMEELVSTDWPGGLWDRREGSKETWNTVVSVISSGWSRPRA